MSYEEDVKRPGKFEGERRYVPYFWEQYLDGGADKDDGKYLYFKITEEDKKKFPELKQQRRKVIKIWEDDVGFVREANPLGRPRFKKGAVVHDTRKGYGGIITDVVPPGIYYSGIPREAMYDIKYPGVVLGPQAYMVPEHRLRRAKQRIRNPHRKAKAGLGLLGLVVLAGAGYMLYRIIKGQTQ